MTTMYKYIKVIFISVISIFLLSLTINYTLYKEAINQNKVETNVDEKRNLAELSLKDDKKLNEIGFSNENIISIRNIALDKLSLRDMLKVFLNKEIQEENITYLTYTNESESMKGDEYVSLWIEPIEAIYNHREERTYVKLYYTATIKKPTFAQNKGQYILMNDEWLNLFGYSKLHYISKNGEKKFEYIGNSLISGVDVDFNVRKTLQGKTFYLKDISGVLIAKKSGYSDISNYSEYKYQKFFRDKKPGQNWARFSILKGFN